MWVRKCLKSKDFWVLAIVNLFILGVMSYGREIGEFDTTPPYLFIPAVIAGLILGNLICLKVCYPLLKKVDAFIDKTTKKGGG